MKEKREEKTSQWTSEDAEPCKKYKAGTCNKDSETCAYAHKCSSCGKSGGKFGHAAVGCWWKETTKKDKGGKDGKGGKPKGKGKGSKGKGGQKGFQSQDE